MTPSGMYRSIVRLLSLGLAAATLLLAQPNDAQPGRLRPDAPAQHEAARKNIPDLGSSEQFMKATRPGAGATAGPAHRRRDAHDRRHAL